MLVATLGRLKTPASLQALLALADDPDVTAHTLSALAKHRAPEVRETLERFSDHHDPLVRKLAANSLRKVTSRANPE